MLALLMMGTASTLAQNVDLHWTSPVKERYVTFYAEPQGKPPEEMTYLIEPANPEPKFQAEWEKEAQINHNLIPENRGVGMEIFNDFKKAVWVPFKTNLSVDFGPGDGERWLRVGFRMKGDELPHRIGSSVSVNEMGGKWDAHYIAVQSSPPTIMFTNPKERVTSQPMIQLQGYSTADLGHPLHYQMFDQHGAVTASGDGLVNDRYLDPVTFQFTTNFFTCYDLELNPGTNTIVLHGEDQAGFSFTTNFVMVFTTVGDTNPPIFKPDWPQDGMSIAGSQFDLRGPCNDPTAIVTAFACDDEGKTTRLGGECERSGYLWVERVPLAEGKNYITVVTTDAAQNSNVTNLMVSKSDVTLYMDPVPDPNQLWQPKITVTGFYSRTNHTVFVNGVKAKMNPNGHWVATDVPVTAGGTASFDLKTDDDDPPPTNSWLPTICGVPTNSLSAGISLPPVSTNEYDHYPVFLGMTNTSGGNIPMTWMLPIEEARFSLHLYDTNNKVVAKREYFEKSGQLLPDNLNIHHLGKNELTNIDGIISFSTDSTARIASLNLDEHIQLPPPGDYRLEIVARMFKIAADGQLVPVEFPPISTTIKIIDQPSEMVFYMNDLARQGKLTWGAERDGLRIGVVHGMKFTRVQDANQIEVFLQNTSTNDYRNWNLRFPSPNEQFDVTLYDASGKEIPKTTLGQQQGQPLSLDGQNPRKAPGLMDEINGFLGGGNVRHGRGLRPIFVSAKDATDCGRFNLTDYFKIKIPGKYRLTYQQRFYRSNTNSILNGIIMPMVTVPLDITYIPGQ